MIEKYGVQNRRTQQEAELAEVRRKLEGSLDKQADQQAEQLRKRASELEAELAKPDDQ